VKKIVLLAVLSVLDIMLLGVLLFLNGCIYRPSADRSPDSWFDEGLRELIEGENPPLPEDYDHDRFTFLIVGKDEGLQTDTIMVATLDIRENTLSILNIPRDTYIHITGKTKNDYSFYGKITNVYSTGRAHARDKRGVAAEDLADAGIEYLKAIIQYTFGIPIEFHVFIDLDGVKVLVEELGGVWFDVPLRMKYTDPAQRLYIDLEKGYQLIDGKKAEQLLRFRRSDKGYPDYSSLKDYPGSDLGRLKTQQNFIMAIMKKILGDFNIDTIKTLFSVGSEYMITNLSMADVVWFAPKLTFVKPQNIRFHAVPSVWVNTHGYNHQIVYKQEAMKMINKYYNPYKEEISEFRFNINDDGLAYYDGVLPSIDIFDIDGRTAED
jgi:LCP family protein required for cell wall assembly